MVTPDETMLCISLSVFGFVLELLLDDLDAIVFLHSQLGSVCTNNQQFVIYRV